MTRLVRVAFVVLCLVELASCATAGSVVKACLPMTVTVDEQQAVTDLFTRQDITTAEAIAIAEAGKIAICAITQVARDVLMRASSIQFSTTVEPPLVARSRAWLGKHP